MAGGYMGKLLWVNLPNGELKDEELDDKFCRDYLGGYGFGAKILFDRQKATRAPEGVENARRHLKMTHPQPLVETIEFEARKSRRQTDELVVPGHRQHVLEKIEHVITNTGSSRYQW